MTKEEFKKVMTKNSILIDIKSIFKDVAFDHKVKNGIYNLIILYKY